VVAKIPDSLRQKVVGEQERRNQRTPSVRCTGLTGLPADGVARALQRVPGLEGGVRVEARGENFVVFLGSSRAFEALMMMNGRMLRSGHTPKFTKFEVKMTCEEVFEFVATELKVQEHSATIGKIHRGFTPGYPDPEETRKGRRLHEVSTSSPPASTGEVGCTPQAPRYPPRERSNTPPRPHRNNPPPSSRVSPRRDSTSVGPSGAPTGKGKGKGKGKGEPGKGGKGGRPPSPFRSRTPEGPGPFSARGVPYDNCKWCGEPGHWHRECPHFDRDGAPRASTPTPRPPAGPEVQH
jgi:hypothetical protein